MAAAALAWGPRPPQTCARCRTSPELRKEWGCDEPAARSTWTLTCWRCGGEDEKCEVCAGRREVDQFRCPQSMAGPHERAVCASADLLEVGILPVAGGWEDQAATFCDAVRIALHERAGYRERRRGH